MIIYISQLDIVTKLDNISLMIPLSDRMRDWLKSFVSSQQLAYKDTFHKCVHVECKSPCIYIVEYEDFETPGKCPKVQLSSLFEFFLGLTPSSITF